MTSTVDDRRRVVLPDKFTKGDTVDIEERPDGSLVLTKMVVPEGTKARLVRVNGRLLISVGRPVTAEEIKKELANFP